MDSNNSYISRLKSRLLKIQERFNAILHSSRLEHYARQPNPFAYFGSNPPKGPDIKIRWVKLSPELERIQNQIQKDFEEWYADYIGLFQNATRDEDAQLKGLYIEMGSWIKYRTDKEIPDSINTATARFGATCEKFIGILDQLTHSGGPSSILVIDTSAIINCPDISQMAMLLNISDATFIFPSTTISELDDLKTGKRDENFRRRLTTAINNLKEIRIKGNVLEGIELPNNIIVKMLAVEPDFSRLPQWLNPQVNDDRILASAIELQRSNPNSNITIIATDINMQNKATMANLPVMEVPDSYKNGA
jgi:hypothetical protein